MVLFDSTDTDPHREIEWSHRSHAVSSAFCGLRSPRRRVTIATAATITTTTTRRCLRSRATAAYVTVEEVVEGASEVRIEDVVDDGVEHGPAVGEPLEYHEGLRRDVRLAGRTGAR